MRSLIHDDMQIIFNFLWFNEGKIDWPVNISNLLKLHLEHVNILLEPYLLSFLYTTSTISANEKEQAHLIHSATRQYRSQIQGGMVGGNSAKIVRNKMTIDSDCAIIFKFSAFINASDFSFRFKYFQTIWQNLSNT